MASKPLTKSGDNMDQLKKLGIKIQGEESLIKSDFSVSVGAVEGYVGQPSRVGLKANAADALADQLSKGFCHGMPMAKSQYAKTDDNKDNFGVKYTKNTHGEEHHSDNDKEVEREVTSGGEVEDRVHADEMIEFPSVKKRIADSAKAKVFDSELERSLDDVVDILKASGEVKMPKKEFVAEHKKLVKVLNSPSHKDDKKEAKEQKKELLERSLDSLILMADDPFDPAQISELHENSEDLVVEKSAFRSGKKSPNAKMFHLKKEPKDPEQIREERRERKAAGLKKSDDKPWPGEGIKGAGMPGKKGEGSHGGKVVGHTTTGKPIYAKNSKPKGTGGAQPPARPATAPRSSGDVMGEADKMQQRSRAEAALAAFKRSRTGLDNIFAKAGVGGLGKPINDPKVMPQGKGVVDSAERGVRNAAASVGSFVSNLGSMGSKLAPAVTSGLNKIRGNTTAIAAPGKSMAKKSELDELVDLVKSKACEAPTLKKKMVEAPRPKAVTTANKSFIVAQGPGGVLMDFGNLTGNPIADNANRILSENFDPVQNNIAQHQQVTYRKALMDHVAGKPLAATEEVRPHDAGDPYGKLDKGFDQQTVDFIKQEQKGFAPVGVPEVSARVNGEVVKAQSETDAMVLEMYKSEMAAMNDGGVVVDTLQKITA